MRPPEGAPHDREFAVLFEIAGDQFDHIGVIFDEQDARIRRPPFLPRTTTGRQQYRAGFCRIRAWILAAASLS
jgi:hypothetical protein